MNKQAIRALNGALLRRRRPVGGLLPGFFAFDDRQTRVALRPLLDLSKPPTRKETWRFWNFVTALVSGAALKTPRVIELPAVSTSQSTRSIFT